MTHDEYDAIERAIIYGRRIALKRRGAEYVVIPRALRQINGREAIVARNPTTGDEMVVYVDELEGVEVVR